MFGSGPVAEAPCRLPEAPDKAKPRAQASGFGEQLEDYAQLRDGRGLGIEEPMPGQDVAGTTEDMRTDIVFEVANDAPRDRQITPIEGAFETTNGDIEEKVDTFTVSKNVKDESNVGILTFMDANAEIIHPKSLLERHFPVVGHIKRWAGAHLPEPMTGLFARVIMGDLFKITSALVITLNYLFIVVQSDFKIRHVGAPESNTLVTVGYVFTSFYIFELAANMTAYGKEFFLGQESGWNMFDFAIVLVSVVEIIVKMSGAAFVNTSFLRIIRFLRISRVLRMFSAMRMFKEIKVMVDTLSGSFSLFFWCTLFFALFLSLIGVFFVQGAASYLEDNDDVDPLFVTELRMYFGSVSRAMLSLFMAVTSGNDWTVFHNVAKQLGPTYDSLFVFYVLFYCVAFINVMTSVFCEKAMRLAKPETSELIARRQEQEVQDAQEMILLLGRVMEDNGSRQITRESFDDFIGHPEVELYFKCRGLRGSSAHRFFKLLCEVNETNKVDFATFISACVKLDGYASSIDMHCLNIRQLHGLHQLQAIQKSQHGELKLLHAIMNDQLGKLNSYMSRFGVNDVEPKKQEAQMLRKDPLCDLEPKQENGLQSMAPRMSPGNDTKFVCSTVSDHSQLSL